MSREINCKVNFDNSTPGGFVDQIKRAGGWSKKWRESSCEQREFRELAAGPLRGWGEESNGEAPTCLPLGWTLVPVSRARPAPSLIGKER